MKITTWKINDKAWVNNTWLAPYSNYIVKLKEYKSGKITMLLDGRTHDVSGDWCSSNGWRYTIKKVLNRVSK